MSETIDRLLREQLGELRDERAVPPLDFADVIRRAQAADAHLQSVNAPLVPSRAASPRHSSRLRLVVAVVGLALVLFVAVIAAGLRGGHRAAATRTTASAGGVTVDVVATDPAAAARVPLAGVTPHDVRVIRAALAALGSDMPITRVVLQRHRPGDDTHPGMRRLVLSLRRPSTPIAQFRDQFLANVFADAVVRGVDPKDGAIGVVPGYETSGPATRRTKRVAPTAYAARIASTLRAAGIGGRVFAFALPQGAAFVEAHIGWATLIGEADQAWLGRLYPDITANADGATGVVIETADGQPIWSYAAWATAQTGGGGIGGSAIDSSAPNAAPTDVRGATRLTVAALDSSRRRTAIDCAAPTATAAAFCRSLPSRLANLFPIASSGVPTGDCPIPAGRVSVRLTGRVIGVKVDRTIGPCDGTATAAWNALLPPRRASSNQGAAQPLAAATLSRIDTAPPTTNLTRLEQRILPDLLRADARGTTNPVLRVLLTSPTNPRARLLAFRTASGDLCVIFEDFPSCDRLASIEAPALISLDPAVAVDNSGSGVAYQLALHGIVPDAVDAVVAISPDGHRYPGIVANDAFYIPLPATIAPALGKFSLFPVRAVELHYNDGSTTTIPERSPY